MASWESEIVSNAAAQTNLSKLVENMLKAFIYLATHTRARSQIYIHQIRREQCLISHAAALLDNFMIYACAARVLRLQTVRNQKRKAATQLGNYQN